MTLLRQKELSDRIKEAASILRGAGESVTLSAVREFVKREYHALWEESQPMLAELGFGDFAGKTLKGSSSGDVSDIRQLCMDFGVELDVSEMIAVPVSEESPMGKRSWMYIGDCTVSNLRAASAHLREQAKNDARRAREISKLTKRVIDIVGENSPLTVSDAAALARERRERGQ